MMSISGELDRISHRAHTNSFSKSTMKNTSSCISLERKMSNLSDKRNWTVATFAPIPDNDKGWRWCGQSVTMPEHNNTPSKLERHWKCECITQNPEVWSYRLLRYRIIECVAATVSRCILNYLGCVLRNNYQNEIFSKILSVDINTPYPKMRNRESKYEISTTGTQSWGFYTTRHILNWIEKYSNS